MKVLALSMVLFLSSCIPQDVRGVEQAVFEATCEKTAELYDIKCGDLLAPIVVHTEYFNPRYKGVYVHGEPYVFVKNKPHINYIEVLIHETVHYIVYNRGGGADVSTCDHEEMARKVASAITGEPIDPNWRWSYGCTKPPKSMF